ncbi:MAG: hypothetical protein FH761_17905 [Firmicutes bacterium]|nr:hypothetical protein [Bacillota bacterium]
MNFKGRVTTIKDNMAKVYIDNKEFESSFLDIGSHLTVTAGDEVVVAFYNNNFYEGAIIAKL